jgi:hypothetical protein
MFEYCTWQNEMLQEFDIYDVRIIDRRSNVLNHLKYWLSAISLYLVRGDGSPGFHSVKCRGEKLLIGKREKSMKCPMSSRSLGRMLQLRKHADLEVVRLENA